MSADPDAVPIARSLAIGTLAAWLALWALMRLFPGMNW